jgi:hypothetical protein
VKRLVVLTLVATALGLPAHADASVSGCRTVDVAHVGRTVLGFVAYKFHQVKRWCWKYPRITYKQVYTYVSDMNKMKYRGLIASTGWYYRWCCGVSSSGHTSFRQAKLENCVPVIGCWHAEYPWVRISVRADGTYRARTGT